MGNNISEGQPRLVVQSFGKESEYRRAIFCLLSYVAHSKFRQVILFTDNPEYFQKRLPELLLDIVLLTPEKIKVMRGKIDFLHRMKIALIEEAFDKGDGPLLYADSDTFFVADPSVLVNQLAAGVAFMHKHEYAFNYLKTMPLPAGEPFQAFFKLITNQAFKNHNQQLITVSPDHASWNAGVMFFHASHRAFIPEVYALTDQFYPSTNNHASEQYAFSVILQTNTQLKPCESVIYHYWYRIKKVIMDELLQNFIQEIEDLAEDEKLVRVRALTQKLPSLLEHHILTLRDNAIQCFHENKFAVGYSFALRAFLKAPGDGKFLRDVGYHTQRALKQIFR